MSENYEVNLLRNVHAVDSKSSISKEFTGLKRKQAKDSRKRRSGLTDKNVITRISAHGGYGNETAEDEQESTIVITI